MSNLITRMTERLGREPTMWGAIHGDLHHGILLRIMTVHPIDFDHLHHDEFICLILARLRTIFCIKMLQYGQRLSGAISN